MGSTSCLSSLALDANQQDDAVTGAAHAPVEHFRTGLGRRQFLAAGAAAGLRGRLAGSLVGSFRAPLCACVAGAAGLSAPAVLAAQATLPFTEIADGIFVRYGLQEPITADNHGAIANIGFVVGDASVCVIDTGTTRQQGEALRKAIARVTDRPVSHIVATHVHLDHIFGHAAFDDLAAARIGHHRLPRALAERGPYYLEQLHALAPDRDADMADTTFVLPDTLVDTRTTIDLGNRRLVLTAWPAAHTDNDLTAFDARTGVLWASDLLFVDRLPTIDGNLLGWLAAMETLAPPEVTAIMPGHGPMVAGSDADAALSAQRAYLTRLRDRVRQAIADGMGITDTIAALGADDPGAWLLHDENHGRNITAAYAELEWE
jgi:quinoprotein relay system zinc metallohydrolase 2